jgi:hypothetical protein
MKRLFTNKAVTIGLAVGLSLGAAGAAFAFFTSTGAGTGAATTGSTTALTISQTGSVTGLLPGGPSATINYTVHNPGAGSEHVGSVTVALTSVTTGAVSGDPVCTTASYSITQGPAINATVAPGGTATGTATIAMLDNGLNQDNCQAANSGGALVLGFTSN